MIKYLKDKYLTWRTGYNKSGRAYIKWREETIVRSAYTIEDMFVNFKYIFPVSVDIFDHAEPFGWYPNEDFEQYMYPNRGPGNNAEYFFARGYRDLQDGKFYLSELLGSNHDQVFVATNNDRDAVMIALQYS